MPSGPVPKRPRPLLVAPGLVLLIAATGLAAGTWGAADRPGPQPPVLQLDPGPRTAVILGRVVDHETSLPLAGAIVRTAVLPPRSADGSGSRRPEVVQVETTATGQFVLADLPPGRFTIDASLDGYAPGAFGQRRVGGPSQSVEVRGGERRTDVVVRLWKLAAIAGRVVDEAGDAVVGVTVRAFPEPLQRVTGPAPTALQTTTDDRGDYRLDGLLPGSYLVAVPQTLATVPISAVAMYGRAASDGASAEIARALGESRAPLPISTGFRLGDHIVQLNGGVSTRHAHPPPPARPGEPLRLYPTTYYPSATAAPEATPVILEPGDERTDISIAIVPVVTGAVSGIVMGPTGPAQHVGVHLMPVGLGGDGFVSRATEAGVAAALTDAAGRFVMFGVPAGQYLATVLVVPRPVGPPPESDRPPARPPALWARTPATVAGAGVTALHLELRPALTVTGELVFEGQGPRPSPERLQGVVIRLVPDGGPGRVPLGPARTNTAGRFEAHGYLPGRYRLAAETLTVRDGTSWYVRAVLVNGRNVAGAYFDLDERTGRIRIVMTDRPRTAAEGTAAFPHVLPGEYLAVAVPEDEVLDLMNEQFVTAIARWGTRLTVATGEAASIVLPVVSLR